MNPSARESNLTLCAGFPCLGPLLQPVAPARPHSIAPYSLYLRATASEENSFCKSRKPHRRPPPALKLRRGRWTIPGCPLRQVEAEGKSLADRHDRGAGRVYGGARHLHRQRGFAAHCRLAGRQHQRRNLGAHQLPGARTPLCCPWADGYPPSWAGATSSCSAS